VLSEESCAWLDEMVIGMFTQNLQMVWLVGTRKEDPLGFHQSVFNRADVYVWKRVSWVPDMYNFFRPIPQKSALIL